MSVRMDLLKASIPAERSTESVETGLKAVIDGAGLRFGTFLMVDPDWSAHNLLTTYPEDWARRYYAERYHRVDPAISEGLRATLTYDWANAPRENPRVAQFFGEAREFGLGEQGLSIPIRGANGGRSLFSVSADFSTQQWGDFKHEQLPGLVVAGYLLHDAARDLRRGSGWEPPRLAPQEREVLRWASEGKSAWDTSVIMNLAEATVKAYLKNAANKLGCANKTHAVARAVRMNLL